ncbi:MAG: dihydrofolate reductase family protein [Myxococcota bacterium]
MRSIVMFNRVSADGKFAVEDGNLDWVVPEPAIDKLGNEGMSQTDTVFFGRRTYEMFASFWPHVLDQGPTAPNPHAPGERSTEMRDLAVWMNQVKKVVFSRSLKHVSWNNSELLTEFSVKRVQAIKEEPGKSIIIFGSGSIVSLLTRHRLIDEYMFAVSPLFLAKGRPLLTDLDSTINLDLIESKSFASGTLLLRYARKG